MDNEAARAALAKGTAKNTDAHLLVHALWAMAAQRDIGLWAAVNPADLPPRDRDLSFETEPARELVSLKDVASVYDVSRLVIQRAE